MIPTLKDWTEGTSVFGRFRSEQLKAVDRAITAYQANRNEKTRGAVGAAWEHWKYVHISGVKSLAANRRNTSNMLALLDAEFDTAGTATPKLGAISRWQMTLPAARPAGFANISDAMAQARIDKAIVDAQCVLQIVERRLRKADADTVTQVRTWFGTTPLAKVRDNFAKLGDKARNGFKNGALELRWSASTTESAATGYGQTWMSFGNPFFDDDKTFSGINLQGRPQAPAAHIQELRQIATDFETPKARKQALEQVAEWCAEPGNTLGECAQRIVKQRPMDYPSVAALMAGAVKFGFTKEMSKRAAEAKLAKDKVSNDAIIAGMNSRYLALTELKCTASGVIIHELTHMVLNTKDHKSPMSASMACYGAALCIDLAATAPEIAITNADSYRLFAECCQM